MLFNRSWLVFGCSAWLAGAGAAWAQSHDAALQRLLAAYPGQLCSASANVLRWCNGASSLLADPSAQPDLKAQLAQPYPAGPLQAPPRTDPGRARNQAFFKQMYGATPAEVARQLVSVPWMPKSAPGQSLQVTRVNRVDERVRAISAELDALPAALKAQVLRPSGGFAWRKVAGEAQLSAHSWGIAIDINTGVSDYWRWRDGPPRPGRPDAPRWRNRIAPEVVAVFERHGFIWGGKWQHYDTMHFEYRPELLTPQAQP
jgi:hypothetical protein